jgi:anti-anti-sigma factor
MTALRESLPWDIRTTDVAVAIAAVELEGEFDLTAADAIVQHAERALAAGRHLILNLSGATFIDSSTIHALFSADAAARKAGRGFVLQFGTRASVARVLAITGADRVLPIRSTRREAIELIDGGGFEQAGVRALPGGAA